MTARRPVRPPATTTKQRIIDAARGAFATQGFSGATMRGIAADAGVTAMALYNYAPSKVALFETVWHDSVEAIYIDYEQVVAGRHSLLDELEAVLDHSREVLVDNPDHIRFVARVLMEREHDDLATVTLEVPAATQFLDELAERAVQRGEIAKAERERLDAFVITLLCGITTVTAVDARALDLVVDAAKWALRRQLLTGTVPG